MRRIEGFPRPQENKDTKYGASGKEAAEHKNALDLYRGNLQQALSLHGITPTVREAIEKPGFDLAGIRPRHVVGLAFESATDSLDIPLSSKIAEFLLSQRRNELSMGGIKRAHLGFDVAYIEMRSESKLNMWSFDLQPQWTSKNQPGRYDIPADVIRSLAQIATTIAQRPSESYAVSTRVTQLDQPEYNLFGGSIVPHDQH